MHKTTTLDQPEEIEKIDKSNMLDHCKKFPNYCKDAIKRAERIEIPKEVKISGRTSIKYVKPRNILIAGMGGSAIGGQMLQCWQRDRLPIPIEICRDYNLPAYTDENTLAFVISYSGKTEETLNAFVDAIRRRCMTITITSGGQLLSLSKKLNIPSVTIPQQFPPRAAFPYLFFPLPTLLTKMRLISDTEQETEEALNVLRSIVRENTPDIPTENNPSKKLALELKGTTPVIYGFSTYEAAAHRLKTQFNENSKLPSRYDVFPELNHNEIVGWQASENLTENFSIILLRDRKEPPEIKARIELTKSLVMKKAKKLYEIYAMGDGRLARMLSLLFFGDFLSVYLAVSRGFDPSPVKNIEYLKMRMRESFDHSQRLRQDIDNLLS